MSKLGSPSHSPFSWGYLGGSKKLGRVMASTVYMNYRSLGGFRNANFMLNSEPLRLFCYPFKSAHGQGLVSVPFWVYWTSPYSSHYRQYT